MEPLTRILTQRSGETLAVLTLAVVLLFFLWVATFVSLRRLQVRTRDLFRAASGADLEGMLAEHLRERRRSDGAARAMEIRLEEVEGRLRSAKRHFGFVRYDAFDDVAGAQSFALAMFDDAGDGAVVTSIVGRSDCRVYGKPLVRGQSERTLSEEEREAIRRAEEGRATPIVSP